MAAAPPEPPPVTRGEPSVVIVNWHRERMTVERVRALCADAAPPPVFVVDNGTGTGGAERLRRALPQATVLAAGTNLGFAGAHNLALPHLRTDFTLLLNNDAQLTAAALARLIAFLDEHPEAGIAGPLLEDAAPPHPIVAAGGRDPGRHGRTHATAAEHAAEIAAGRPYAVDYVPGTVALVRTDLLRRLGGFDSTYFFSGEMADLCARALAAGQASFVVPTARARHDLETAAELREVLYPYYSLRNRFLYVRRHPRHDVRLALAVWTARGVLAVGAAMARGRGRRARALAMAVADGLRGRFGPAREELAT